MSSAIKLVSAAKLRIVKKCEILMVWQSVEGKIPEYSRINLENARMELEDFWNLWNEEEIKMHFVSVVLNATKISIRDEIQTFYERKMIGTARGLNFSIICECMIATPTNAYQPAVPYFFFSRI